METTKNFRDYFGDKIASGKIRLPVTLSDTHEFLMPSFTDPTQDVNDDRYCDGFCCNTSGTLRITNPRVPRPADQGGGYWREEESVDIEVVSGKEYYQAVGKFSSAGTDAGLHAASMIWAFRV